MALLDSVGVLVIRAAVFHAEPVEQFIAALLFRYARVGRAAFVKCRVNFHVFFSNASMSVSAIKSMASGV